MYGTKGEFNKAIKDFSEAIRLNPDDAHAYVFRGTAYKMEGDKQQAEADFSKYESLNAKN